MGHYAVTLYYSGTLSIETDAESEDEAIIKARQQADTMSVELENLEPWFDCDTAELIDHQMSEVQDGQTLHPG